MTYYFAYGSCMDANGRIRKDGYYEDFQKVGVARVDGYQFKLNKLSGNGDVVYANIEKNPRSVVYGILYKISDRAKEYLDHREGYPNHYGKQYIQVSVEGQEIKNVLTYIARPSYLCREAMPISEQYEAELKKGGELLPATYRKEMLEEINRCVGIREAKISSRKYE
ncbi:AIG2 family protein [Desulfotomaculum nigrificans CO-1-SRB]|uniref:AIG2 family protein n=1 Tax=Desulfotomaculum nigrificans (strain DSM 14880 / VKM B-2319 / CO-1-SRB) TaxID=868595 RepID=F6B887_DESCC|nr:gamma-glutamylcyclotransferase family protein [Desulfotomaculum nigrificans]AEF93532.1 AIG2 family protein [Desulfotomaculum nigrificans CO-1-SRB]